MTDIQRGLDGHVYAALPQTCGQRIRVRELRCRTVQQTTELVADAAEIMRAARGESSVVTSALLTTLVQHEVLIAGVAHWFPVDSAVFLAIYNAMRGIDADRRPPDPALAT